MPARQASSSNVRQTGLTNWFKCTDRNSVARPASSTYCLRDRASLTRPASLCKRDVNLITLASADSTFILRDGLTLSVYIGALQVRDDDDDDDDDDEAHS